MHRRRPTLRRTGPPPVRRRTDPHEVGRSALVGAAVGVIGRVLRDELASVPCSAENLRQLGAVLRAEAVRCDVVADEVDRMTVALVEGAGA